MACLEARPSSVSKWVDVRKSSLVSWGNVHPRNTGECAKVFYGAAFHFLILQAEEPKVSGEKGPDKLRVAPRAPKCAATIKQRNGHN